MQKILFLSFMLFLAGCTTVVRETQPATTATQQYLIAQSAINAANQIVIKNPASLGKVYIDTSEFEGTKYTIGQIEFALLKTGVSLTTDQKAADTTITIIEGVQSVDNRTVSIGLPSIPIPLPIPIITLSTPSITVAKKDQNVGITLIGLVAWDNKTGQMVENLGDILGLSYNTIWSGAATMEHNNFDKKTVP